MPSTCVYLHGFLYRLAYSFSLAHFSVAKDYQAAFSSTDIEDNLAICQYYIIF